MPATLERPPEQDTTGDIGTIPDAERSGNLTPEQNAEAEALFNRSFSGENASESGFERLPYEEAILEANRRNAQNPGQRLVTQQQVAGTNQEAIRNLEAPLIQRRALAQNPANPQAVDKKGRPQMPPEEAKKIAEDVEKLFREKKYGQALIKLRKPEVRRALADRVDELIKEAAKEQAKEFAKDQLKKWGERIALQAARSALVASAPVWGPIALIVAGVILLICIIVFVIFLVVSIRQPADNPPGGTIEYGVGSADNPLGIYLRPELMVPELSVKENGKSVELRLETYATYHVRESPVSKVNGKWRLDGDQRLGIALGDYVLDRTEEEMDFYANMRFPYCWGVNFDDAHCPYGSMRGASGIQSLPVSPDLAINPASWAREMVVFNPETKIAIKVIAAEWGPSPSFGACGEARRTRAMRNSPSCEEQREAWNSREIIKFSNMVKEPGGRNRLRTLAKSGQLKADISAPSNYSGAGLGLAPEAVKALGLRDNTTTRLIVGWPGPEMQNRKIGEKVTITDADIVTTQANIPSETLPTAGALNVPGVSQGQGGDCGDASAAGLALYYITNNGKNPVPEPGELPAFLKGKIERIPAAERNKRGDYQTNPNDSWGNICSPDKVEQAIRASGGPQDFVNAKNFTSKNQLVAAVNSIRAGDPVVIYTTPGGWYNYFHIYILVGFDGSEFIVNNMKTGCIDRGIKGNSTRQCGGLGQPQTFAHLFKHRGDLQRYGHTLIIRKKHCPNPNSGCISATTPIPTE